MNRVLLSGELAQPLEDGVDVTCVPAEVEDRVEVDAARDLFVHRNTVHYRLRRIEALCGLDLARVEDRMLCQIALLSARMGDPTAGVV